MANKYVKVNIYVNTFLDIFLTNIVFCPFLYIMKLFYVCDFSLAYKPYLFVQIVHVSGQNNNILVQLVNRRPLFVDGDAERVHQILRETHAE